MFNDMGHDHRVVPLAPVPKVGEVAADDRPRSELLAQGLTGIAGRFDAGDGPSALAGQRQQLPRSRPDVQQAALPSAPRLSDGLQLIEVSTEAGAGPVLVPLNRPESRLAVLAGQIGIVLLLVEPVALCLGGSRAQEAQAALLTLDHAGQELPVHPNLSQRPGGADRAENAEWRFC